ncbi:S41 family peptidase [Xanthomonas floridensis]|uniref:S41 family peptidase n=1 Tax=Xanthomonas floridensis TaxID=1843580 RepID=A0ABU5PXQ8_9XANT|nr:S41 family peptidase [Xanthomonas floridensis]MEA5124232.1 S41 family peptidase [Xanthomonas floridensis]MEA5131784.1 S41 family peptidase [Xanthomonas floridensis]
MGITCALAFSVAQAAPVLDQNEQRALPQAVADALDAQYIDPGLAKRMRQALRQHAARGDYAAIADPAALAKRLTDDLRAVSHDGHLWLEYHPEAARDEPLTPSRAELDAARPAVARDNFAFDKVERLAGNIGYLKFRIFAYPYLAAATASSAMDFVAHSDALIIDLRDNAGGDPAMVAYLASYLFDERVRLNDIYSRSSGSSEQYWTTPGLPGRAFGGRKPLYILTSRQTFSAAEDFAYALQTLGRATIVGESTGGGAHPSRGFKVSAHFVAVVPYARSVSPITHTNWEGSGVVPDVTVSAAQAQDTAYRLSIERLIAASSNPDEVAGLRALLEPGRRQD